jgi:hypothetical protein
MIIYLFSEDKYKILMVRKIILILNLSWRVAAESRFKTRIRI